MNVINLLEAFKRYLDAHCELLWCQDDENATMRQDHAISEEVATSIQTRDYATLRRALCDTNPSGICTVNDIDFSGLELSVCNVDWKMLLIFFLAGANPATHWFRGRAYSPSLSVMVYPSVHDARKVPTVDNSGFNRLRLILEDDRVFAGLNCNVTEDTPKVEAMLWLLERLHGDTVDATNAATMSEARLNMHLVNPTFDWGDSFSVPARKLVTTYRSLGVAKGWPNAIVDPMAAMSLQDLLTRTIRNGLDELVVGISTL